MVTPTVPRSGGAAVAGEDAVHAARAALLASLAVVPIYDLAIEVETLSPITLSEHPGSALRGALVQALLDAHCTNKAALTCAACPLVGVCPVSALVAPMRDEAPGGRDIPRPFTITPPYPAPTRLEAGARWTFGLTLFGSAAALFPYVVLSRSRLEANGLGLREESGRRGRIAIRSIASVTGNGGTTLYEAGATRVGAPVSEDGAVRLTARAASLPEDRLTLDFRSPMRLKAGGDILRVLHPSVLAHRILERWEALRREYGRPGVDDPLMPLRGLAGSSAQADPRALLAAADTVRVERDATRWVELASYSSRQRRFTPIGGLVGEVTLAGRLGPLREVLALGEAIRAGKDVVKGNGRYIIRAADAQNEEGRGWN